MDMDVRAWLEGLGLGAYADAFEENFIDGQVLVQLTPEDLKEIGVTAVGHRRRLIDAIAALGTQSRVDDVTAERPTGPGSSETPPADSNVGERRQVTVMFADICGFTKLTASIDSEEVHALLSAYFELADTIVRDFGGSVDKHVGDSVMAVFGAPISHGNDAERALRAALAIQEGMPLVSERIGRSVEAHIGIAAGEVVASGVGPDTHYTVIGDSVNLAARLTDKAQAGEIFVSAAVRQSVTGVLASTDMGEVAVKGLDAPVRVYSVDGLETKTETSLERPFVGRAAEISQFKSALDTCHNAGRGQLIQIRGEAGIGKTRLTNEFCRLANEKGFHSHRSLVLDFGVGKGQDPVRMLVRSLLSLTSSDDEQSRQAAATSALAEGWISSEHKTHLWDLLDLPQSPDDRAIYDAMDNLTRARGKQATVVELASNLSKRAPIMIVFEDLHWADKLVLQSIIALGRGAAESRILIVLTSRIDGDPFDQMSRGITASMPRMTLDLGPLSASEAMGMVAGFADTAENFARTCIEKAAGNPLFLEQLLRSAEEAGEAQVPGSVQSIVQARLDRLPPRDKLAVQAASVLGQRFSSGALRHLIGDTEYECERLIAHHLIQEQSEDYLFTHALVRDGVYGSLLKARRTKLHREAAAWFEAEGDLTLRAEHLEQAAHPDAARAYLDAAQSQKAALRLEQAFRLAEKGLGLAKVAGVEFELNCLMGELLRELGEPERSIKAFELALKHPLAPPQKALALLGVAEGMRIVERIDEALTLLGEAQAIAEAEHLDEVLMRLHHLRGNLMFPKGDIAGCETGHQQSIEVARQIGSAEGEARGLGGLGDAAYVAGRMRTAHDRLLRCVEICREHGYGRTEVANAAQICHTKIFMLEPRNALELGRETVKAARRVGHDRAELNAGAACLFAAIELGEWTEAEVHAAHVFALGERLGSFRFSQEAMAFRGRVLDATGNKEEALSAIRGAIEAARKSGFSFGGPRMLGHLLRISRDPLEQDAALSEGEEVIAQGCVGHNQPFFYRDAMELMLDRGDWAGVKKYADALAEFAEEDALPWRDFYVARAQELAAWGAGKQDSAAKARLEQLCTECQRTGLAAPMRALSRALSSGNR